MCRYLILSLGLLLLSGCAPPLYKIDLLSTERVESIRIVDRRSIRSVKGGKPRVISHEYYHGDDSFNPSKLELFQSALHDAFPGAKPDKIILKKFDVISNMAHSIGTVQMSGLAGINYPLAVALQSSMPTDADFIVCIIQARVDGKEVSSAALKPYRPSPLNSPFNDPTCVAAVTESVNEALSLWIEEARKMP